MISDAVMEALKRFVRPENIHIQEVMAAHTTFRVGGPADCLVELEDVQQLQNIQHYLHLVGIPYVILGNGSNVLVSDEGYRGVVLQVANRMNRITVEGNRVVAQAGALMSQVAKAALENGLTGMEFASGIPGTVGGGTYGSAGTDGSGDHYCGERSVGIFSGVGVYFCLCVYHGWLHAGAVPGSAGGSVYCEISQRLSGRCSVSGIQYGNLSGVPAFYDPAVCI